jgi:hypothetical protein
MLDWFSKLRERASDLDLVETDGRRGHPPGATEAEFAYLKAQSIKAGDEPYNYFRSKRHGVLMPSAVQKAHRYAPKRKTR